MRGVGTVRSNMGFVIFAEDGETRVNHYIMGNSTYFSLSFDECGDAVVSVKGELIDKEWYYVKVNFQYIGLEKATTALSGPIITINEPIG
jgi:hypothetical protein